MVHLRPGAVREKFFFPFHQLYTAGLYETDRTQDAYKSPVGIAQAIRGVFNGADPAGYNVSFAYPAEGLNALAWAMSGEVRRPVRQASRPDRPGAEARGLRR